MRWCEEHLMVWRSRTIAPDDSLQVRIAKLSIQSQPFSWLIRESHENQTWQTTLLYFLFPQKVDNRYLLHYPCTCRHNTDMIRSVLQKILLIFLCHTVLPGLFTDWQLDGLGYSRLASSNSNCPKKLGSVMICIDPSSFSHSPRVFSIWAVLFGEYRWIIY